MIRKLFRLDVRRANVPRAVDEELAFHIATRIDALVKQGMNPEDARREAERQFGKLDAVRDDCITLDEERVRASRRANMLDELGQDIRHGARLLRRNYGSSLAIVLMLSLSIGVNTGLFTLTNAVLLRPLPVSDPDRLLAVGNTAAVSDVSQGDVRSDLLSYPMYRMLRADSALGPHLLASGVSQRINVRVETGQQDVEHPQARMVSGNYFGVLGVRAQRGRTFDTREDGGVGASPTAVISDAYWTRRFDRNPDAIGRTIMINGIAVTIAGVTPPDFTGEIVGMPQDMWLPITLQPLLNPATPFAEDVGASWLLLLQRVPDGMSLSQVNASLTARITLWMKDHLSAEDATRISVYIGDGSRGFSRSRAQMTAPLAALMTGAALLLLLVCANIANLLLARAVARGREMSVRLALGARRERLIRQLLTESLLLAIAGAVGGIFMAWGTIQVLFALQGDGNPPALNLAIDTRVWVFTAAAAIGSVGFFGIAPALQTSAINLASAMRGTIGWERGRQRSQGGRRFGMNQLLVVGQVALSLTLLVGAGLLARDLRNLQRLDTGTAHTKLLTVDINAAGSGYEGTRHSVLAEQLRSQLGSLPGVDALTYSESGLFSGSSSSVSIEVPGYTLADGSTPSAGIDGVGPKYVATIGATLIAGRDISEHDTQAADRVTLVNESFAKRFFANGRALDATFTSGGTAYRIIGIVADIKDRSLQAVPSPRFYAAYAQGARNAPRRLFLIARAAGDPGALAAPIRAEIKRIDPTLEIASLNRLSDRIARSLTGERSMAQIAGGLGLLALLLASIGLYGVMSYAVSRRSGEVGLRMALGADRVGVVRLILFDALRLVGLGMAVGIPASLGLAQLMQGQLHGVHATDPLTIGGALVILSGTAAFAAFLPALRASRIPPMRAMRQS